MKRLQIFLFYFVSCIFVHASSIQVQYQQLPTQSVVSRTKEFAELKKYIPQQLYTWCAQAYFVLEYWTKIEYIQTSQNIELQKKFSRFIQPQDVTGSLFAFSSQLAQDPDWQALPVTQEMIAHSSFWQLCLQIMFAQSWEQSEQLLQIIHQMEHALFVYFPEMEFAWYEHDCMQTYLTAQAARTKLVMQESIQEHAVTKSEILSTLSEAQHEQFVKKIQQSTMYQMIQDQNFLQKNMYNQILYEQALSFHFIRNVQEQLYAVLMRSESAVQIINLCTAMNPTLCEFDVSDSAYLQDLLHAQNRLVSLQNQKESVQAAPAKIQTAQDILSSLQSEEQKQIVSTSASDQVHKKDDSVRIQSVQGDFHSWVDKTGQTATKTRNAMDEATKESDAAITKDFEDFFSGHFDRIAANDKRSNAAFAKAARVFFTDVIGKNIAQQSKGVGILLNPVIQPLLHGLNVATNFLTSCFISASEYLVYAFTVGDAKKKEAERRKVDATLEAHRQIINIAMSIVMTAVVTLVILPAMFPAAEAAGAAAAESAVAEASALATESAAEGAVATTSEVAGQTAVEGSLEDQAVSDAGNMFNKAAEDAEAAAESSENAAASSTENAAKSGAQNVGPKDFYTSADLPEGAIDDAATEEAAENLSKSMTEVKSSTMWENIQSAFAKFPLPSVHLTMELLNYATMILQMIGGDYQDEQLIVKQMQDEQTVKSGWKAAQEGALNLQYSSNLQFDEMHKKLNSIIANQQIGLVFYQNYLNNASVNSKYEQVALLLAGQYEELLTPQTDGTIQADIGSVWGLQTVFNNVYPQQGMYTVNLGRTDFPYAQEIAQAPTLNKTVAKKSTDILAGVIHDDSADKFWFNQKVVAVVQGATPTMPLSVQIRMREIYSLQTTVYAGLYLGGNFHDYRSADYLQSLQDNGVVDVDAAHGAKMCVLIKELGKWYAGVYEHEVGGWIAKDPLPVDFATGNPSCIVEVKLDGTKLQFGLKNEQTNAVWTKSYSVTPTDQRTFGVIASGVALEWDVLYPKFPIMQYQTRTQNTQVIQSDANKQSIKNWQTIMKPTFGTFTLKPLSRHHCLCRQFVYSMAQADYTDYVVFAQNTNGTVSGIGIDPSQITGTPVVVSLISEQFLDQTGAVVGAQPGIYNLYTQAHGSFGQAIDQQIQQARQMYEQNHPTMNVTDSGQAGPGQDGSDQSSSQDVSPAGGSGVSVSLFGTGPAPAQPVVAVSPGATKSSFTQQVQQASAGVSINLGF